MSHCCIYKSCIADKIVSCFGRHQHFIVRRDSTPLEFSGDVFRVVSQDENIVVANKINHCYADDDKTCPYAFDKKAWTIIYVHHDIAKASAW